MSSPGARPSLDSLTSPFSGSQPSQYPFPISDASVRSSSRTRLASRRGSNASTVSSIGGVLDTSLHHRGTINESGQNAISTLLQPPILGTGRSAVSSAAFTPYKQPSSKDIRPVTLTNIPTTDSTEFKTYLSQIGSLYDAFQRTKASLEDGAHHIFRKDNEAAKLDEFADLLDRRNSRQSTPGSPRHGSIASSVVSLGETVQPRRSSGGGSSRRLGLTVAPLSTIPGVYFENDFHLENPRTFDVVSERADIVRPIPGTPDEKRGMNGSFVAPLPSPRKPLATNAILQEKLSWYMDTVEVHLISSISTASASFFAALGSLRELHSEAAESVDRIKRLRATLQELDDQMAVGGLKIVNMRRRRENLRRLGSAMEQLRVLVENITDCEDLVERGAVDKALENISRVELRLSGESNDPSGEEVYNLGKIKALESIPESLGLLKARIGKVFETRFLEALLGDVRSHVANVPSSETLQRWDTASQRARGTHNRAPSSVPRYLTMDDGTRSKLSSSLDGLTRSGQTMSAAATYREAIYREIKNLIRTHLPSSTDDDNDSMLSVSTHGGRQLSSQEKSSILARNLRALDGESAEEMLVKIYTSVGEALRRLSTHVKVLLDVTSMTGVSAGSERPRIPSRSPSLSALDRRANSPRSGSPAPTARVQEELIQALDMSSLLSQAVEIAQTQITKILKVRTEQSVNLPLSMFLRYFTLNRLFADECEAISGQGGVALKTLVNTHIKDFVNQLGDSERQRLAQSMEKDTWDAKDFADQDSLTLSRILGGSTRDAEIWTRSGHLWEHVTNGTITETVLNGLATNGTDPAGALSKEKVRRANIEEQKFILPQPGMTVLHGIEIFENFMVVIPNMTQEAAMSLLEYLKLFNSRLSQLILGAGATRTAGLKNITTRHLALASQALSFVTELIPYVREFVRRHSSSPANLMAEFDKVKRLYQEHQQGIQDKLVEIMTGRASNLVSEMKKVDWDRSDGSGSSVHQYMEILTKDTGTLHRALTKHMPEMSVQMIMNPIFQNYRTQWAKAFGEATIKTESGKSRLVRDAEHFRSRMSKLDGAGDLGDHIVNIATGKVVGDGSKPVESTPVSGEGTNGAKEEPEGHKDPGQGQGQGQGQGDVREERESPGVASADTPAIEAAPQP